jgi:hypothetical protein
MSQQWMSTWIDAHIAHHDVNMRFGSYRLYQLDAARSMQNALDPLITNTQQLLL